MIRSSSSFSDMAPVISNEITSVTKDGLFIDSKRTLRVCLTRLELGSFNLEEKGPEEAKLQLRNEGALEKKEISTRRTSSRVRSTVNYKEIDLKEEIEPTVQRKRQILKEDSDDSDYEARESSMGEDKVAIRKKKKQTTDPKTEYEKMVEQRKAEALAFLKTLGIDDVKASLKEAVNVVSKRKTRVYAKKELPPKRPLSSRVQNSTINYREDQMKVIGSVETKKKPEPVPSVLSFEEALVPGPNYLTFRKDIKRHESKREEIFYNRSSMQNLTLRNFNIAEVKKKTTGNFKLIEIRDIAWYPSANDLIIASGNADGKISFWNVNNSYDYSFKIHDRAVTHIQFNPYNPVEIFSSCSGGIIRCGDMVQQEFSRLPYRGLKFITYFDFLTPETCLVAWNMGAVSVIDRRYKSDYGNVHHKCHDHPITTVDVHPVKKEIFVSADKRGSMRLWDLRKMQNPITHRKLTNQPVNSAFFSPVIGNYVLTSGINGAVRIFDYKILSTSPQCKMFENKQDSNMFGAHWLPNSEMFAIGVRSQDDSRSIKIYDTKFNDCYSITNKQLTDVTHKNIFHPFVPALACIDQISKSVNTVCCLN